MQRLPQDAAESARPLYDGFTGLHGALDAALKGSAGEVYVDDAKAPRVARITIGDFHAIAGDTNAPGAPEALLAVPDRDHIAVADGWHDLVHETIAKPYPYDRFAFSAPDRWDEKRLAKLVASLPAEYRLIEIDRKTVKAFRDLNETFVANFRSLDDYLERGVGFGVLNESGEMVAGCSTYTISSRCLEFEIETRRDYQRRGLALVTGARMVQHCLEAGLEPAWDAAHAGSAALAERIGFTGRRRYTAYRIGAPAGPPEQDG
jgi:GNAT superfamily N-acetyltransferase